MNRSGRARVEARIRLVIVVVDAVAAVCQCRVCAGRRRAKGEHMLLVRQGCGPCYLLQRGVEVSPRTRNWTYNALPKDTGRQLRPVADNPGFLGLSVIEAAGYPSMLIPSAREVGKLRRSRKRRRTAADARAAAHERLSALRIQRGSRWAQREKKN